MLAQGQDTAMLILSNASLDEAMLAQGNAYIDLFDISLSVYPPPRLGADGVLKPLPVRATSFLSYLLYCTSLPSYLLRDLKSASL